jgi:nitrite reductase/ring-hydroxylating ferredoxin subunit
MSYKLDNHLINHMPIVKTTLKKGDLQEQKLVKVEGNDKSIVLTNINGKLYAMDSVCSHKRGSLGRLEIISNQKGFPNKLDT